MIEVLFTEGAAGSMMLAKGRHSISAEAFGIILTTDDGHAPTEDEIARERARVEEERRNKIENMVPTEGDSRDVACFPLNLSMGDISEPFSDQRADYLQSTVMIGGPDFANIGRELMETARKSLARVLAAAEPVRIWYSRNPDELCGFCHILTLLPEDADIRVVELPQYTVQENEIRTYSGWAEVDPMELGQFQRLERPLMAVERRYFAEQWRDLQRENSPLRAVINGRLCSVGEDFYDPILLRALQMQPERFHEARLIGEILGKTQLGLSDSLIALRIEEFISREMLAPVTEPAEDRPVYHRYLQKGALL